MSDAVTVNPRRRQVDRGVPATGRDVKCAGPWQNLNVCQRRGDVCGVGEDMGFPVVRAVTFELIAGCLLDRVESHLMLVRTVCSKDKLLACFGNPGDTLSVVYLLMMVL